MEEGEDRVEEVLEEVEIKGEGEDKARILFRGHLE